MQATEWSRKTNLAGRPVEDVRLHEFCLQGMGEFSLRMLSEGSFQSLAWTRTAAEGVLTTQNLKALRYAKIDIDAVAQKCLQSKKMPVADKHKQAKQFMAPLVEEIMQQVRTFVPVEASTNDQEELTRAKAKLAMASITLTPRRPASPPQDEDQPEPSSSHKDLLLAQGSQNNSASDGKRRKAAVLDVDPADEVKQLLSGKPVTSLKDSRPKAVSSDQKLNAEPQATVRRQVS